MTIGLELCAGTMVVGLSALAGHPVQPLIGYMGSKRRWAREIADLAFRGGIDELIAVDGGPWGDAWATLVQPGQASLVAKVLWDWDRQGLLPDLWPTLAEQPPDADPVLRAARFLAIQGRTASNIPVWFDADRACWVAPTGSRAQVAGQRHRGRRPPCAVDKAAACHAGAWRAGVRRQVSSGLVRLSTLAARVDALVRLPLDRLTVIHGRVEDVAPVAGASVFFDPPYEGCPRYALELPRAAVLEVARRHAEVARQVVVAEGEPLPLTDWSAHQLTPREWLTFTGPDRPRGVQLRLFV